MGTEGKIKFYREVEVKHARMAMLAAIGFPVAEQFHPLFASDDAPSFTAFQQTPLQTFWPAVVFAIAIPEVFSTFNFSPPTETKELNNGRLAMIAIAGMVVQEGVSGGKLF